MSKKPHGIACPHCGSATSVRYSRSVTPTYRQLQLQCANVECGATYGAELAITHVISPSATPNPAILLRASAPRRRAANDEHPPVDAIRSDLPPPANDLKTPGLATG